MNWKIFKIAFRIEKLYFLIDSILEDKKITVDELLLTVAVFFWF